MAQNPVEADALTQFVLGLALIVGLFLGGGAVGWLFASLAVPYGAWIGAAVGAVGAFVLFAVLYGRSDVVADPA